MGGKGTADPPASSGGASAGPSASAPSTGTAGAQRACEACEAAPGIPFCRVEWSFLCASCGPALHRNSWIVAVPPFPTSNPPTTNPTTTSTTPSTNQPPPYYFPPFMQMPLPPQAPFQMPMHMLPSNPNPTSNAFKRRRRRRSKEEMLLGPARTDTDTDRAEADSGRMVRYGQNRKTRLRPSVPAPTRANSGNADTELQPGVKDTMIPNVPESAIDEVQVDAMEKITAEMDPPPPELDEIEEAIAAEGEP